MIISGCMQKKLSKNTQACVSDISAIKSYYTYTIFIGQYLEIEYKFSYYLNLTQRKEMS